MDQLEPAPTSQMERLSETQRAPGAGRFVVWGIGDPTPHGFFDEEISPSAHEVATEHDPGWAEDQSGWAVVVSATEPEIDLWVRENDSARGYSRVDEDEIVALEQPIKVEEPRPY